MYWNSEATQNYFLIYINVNPLNELSECKKKKKKSLHTHTNCRTHNLYKALSKQSTIELGVPVNEKIFSSLLENPSQVGRGYVAITILDINDNAPEFAMDYETTVCENAQPGQVRGFRIPASLFVISLKIPSGTCL